MYTTDLITLPRFIFTRDGFVQFPKLTRSLGLRFAIIGGKTAMEKGLPELQSAIQESDCTIVSVLPFGGECTLLAIERLVQQLRGSGIDFLVGMGGGKAIDTAKAVAHDLSVPLVSLPTLVSNCAPITALSVVYREDGPFDRFLFYPEPPALTMVNLKLTAGGPESYFRAGMGDAMAKFPESTFSARGDAIGETLDHMSLMGVTLSSTCWEPILKYGNQALKEATRHEPGSCYELVARCIIISAGLVSLLAHDDYNCAVAHSVCYGLQTFPDVERNYLHGDLVAYGMLVQLVMDSQTESAIKVRSFLKSIGTPVTLREMGLTLDRQVLNTALLEMVSGPDMAHIPYPVTPDMLFESICRVEEL